jgi:flagellar hook-length control protein FliK
MSDTGTEPVVTQLATVIAPAAHQPDGSYQVTIRLQPDDLGPVHVELRLEGSVVNVSLQADGDATRDMLRQNLGQLRQQLTDAGLTTGNFDVGNGPASRDESGGRQPGAGPADISQYQSSEATLDDGTTASPAAPISGLLDVRL